jgi:hypothetical protein
MRTNTKRVFMMLGAWVVGYGLTFATVCPIVGCGQCEARFDDGSCASDAGPVLAEELDGEWCEAPKTDGSELCFVAHSNRYSWSSWKCRETGTLSGGLEFTPDNSDSALPVCISRGFYSASVDWVKTGIEVFPDVGRKPLKLNWTE